MGLDDFDGGLDSFDSGSEKVSTGNEQISEAFKEALKKSTAKAQKLQKDEKKAQKYDLMLSGFLIKIILNKEYDDLLKYLFDCLDKRFPSNFLIGIFSLIYEEISIEIRKISGKAYCEFNCPMPNNYIKFTDDMIDAKTRARINFWVEDLIDVVMIDYSEMGIQRLSWLIEDEKKVLEEYMIQIFIFFFKKMNIEISRNQAYKYVNYILGELKKSYKKINLDNLYEDLKE